MSSRWHGWKSARAGRGTAAHLASMATCPLFFDSWLGAHALLFAGDSLPVKLLVPAPLLLWKLTLWLHLLWKLYMPSRLHFLVLLPPLHLPLWLPGSGRAALCRHAHRLALQALA